MSTPTCPLFVPADRLERFEKAARSGADAVIIDLEDAVAPDAKASARSNLDQAPFDALPVFLRINGSRTAFQADDLDAAHGLPFAGFFLPKADTLEDIAVVRLATDRPLIAMVESALGLSNAREIAAAQGVVRLAFGSLDFAADLGCDGGREALLTARSELVLASRLAGIAAPLDGVTANLEDPVITEDDAHYAASLGFGGKLAIHPEQVAGIFTGFAPSADEVAWALQVLAHELEGAERIGDDFADAPVRRRAEAIMARHQTGRKQA